MATVSSKRARPIEYSTSDGKPMAETEYHRDLMIDLIRTLKTWFARKPKMYVSGNLLMYYEPGNKRKTEGRMASAILGLELEPAGHELRLYNPQTGELLPTPEERTGLETERADQERERADQEKARADRASRDIARLAEENEQQRQLLEKILRAKKNGH
jgi:hypothetical protein